MVNKTGIPSLVNNPEGRHHMSIAVAMAVAIVAALLIMPACQRKPVMAHSTFVHLPSAGWQRTLPLSFSPQYDDSAMTYSVTLAVRHSNSYPYSNLSLVVDVIDDDAAVQRHRVDMPLADEYGNWTGGGFGALYQKTVSIASGVVPSQARSVVVWQTIEACDTLSGVLDVGIITAPSH